ncbi:MAG: hypothetical protein IT430_14475 [Phycisphaerales bacterium]|nr:hypothetical protein [Phycisphaerales bacterium]
MRCHAKSISGPAVVVPIEVRPIIGARLLEGLFGQGVRVLVIAVAGMHAHLLTELPEDRRAAKQVVGKAKNFSSRKVRRLVPGRIWAGGGALKPIRDKAHQRNTYRYIRDRQGVGAWVWTFREPVPLLSD